MVNVNPSLIEHTDLSKVLSGLMVMVAAFGFATIVPSLKVYFEGNVKKLRTIIIIGSFIPLIFYILWDLAILGTLPLEGEHGLVAILKSGHITSELMNALQDIVQKSTVTTFSKIFSSICVATSFLGVALSLSDFLSDGLGIEKKGFGNLKIQLLTFAPPLFIVLLYPSVFLIALDYAGIFTVILLTLLPVLMVWRGRYHLNFKGPYQVAGGKVAMAVCLIGSVGAVAVGVLQQFGFI
jgi:tyrosine-specific transport protein